MKSRPPRPKGSRFCGGRNKSALSPFQPRSNRQANRAATFGLDLPEPDANGSPLGNVAVAVGQEQVWKMGEFPCEVGGAERGKDDMVQVHPKCFPERAVDRARHANGSPRDGVALRHEEKQSAIINSAIAPRPAPLADSDMPRQTSRGRRGVIDLKDSLALGLLLIAPSCALGRLSPAIDWRALIGVPLAVSIYGFFLYRSDKRRAIAGEWRIPESTLHFAALAGGWPGAFLAQRAFRHKTAKTSFPVVFWLIVLTHQFIAVDSLLDWRLTKSALRFINS